MGIRGTIGMLLTSVIHLGWVPILNAVYKLEGIVGGIVCEATEDVAEGEEVKQL